MTSSLNIVDVSELIPVQAALLRRAHADAETELAGADRDTADVNAAATAQVTQLLDQSRAQAADDVMVLEAAERSRGLREARSIQLQARRATYDALVSAAAAAVRDELADDPEVVSALSERARTELGADAILSRLPDGGLVAEAGGGGPGRPPASVAPAVAATAAPSRARREAFGAASGRSCEASVLSASS